MDKQVDMGFESEGDDKNMNAAVRRRRAEQKAEADEKKRALQEGTLMCYSCGALDSVLLPPA